MCFNSSPSEEMKKGRTVLWCRWSNRRRGWLSKSILIMASLIIGCLLSEGLARLILEPADILGPVLIHDPVLGHRVMPNSAGYDAWGFRNASVPLSAPVVAIGDSQTFGAGVARRVSWPAVLEAYTGQPVYSLSLSGYGPFQYAQLLVKALQLAPEYVLVGLYIGNDLLGAYHAVYMFESGRPFRQEGFVKQNRTSRSQDFDVRLRITETRVWLAQHSMIYRLLSRSPLVEPLRQLDAQLDAGHEIIRFDDGVRSAIFDVTARYLDLNLDDVRVQEGLRLTKVLLATMHDCASAHNTPLLVVLIPTKARVFAPLLQAQDMTVESPSLARLISNEEIVSRELVNYLNEQGIPVIDPLIELRRGLVDQALFLNALDIHFSAAGYRLLASVIAKALAFTSENNRKPQKQSVLRESQACVALQRSVGL